MHKLCECSYSDCGFAVSLQASLLPQRPAWLECGPHLTLFVAFFNDRQNVSMATHISFPAWCGPIHEAFVT